MIVNGYQNEINFQKALNNKYVYELDDNMRNLLKKLFTHVNEKDYISCYKSFKTDKADIIIVLNNVKKYISIKCGKINSVHMEHILTFEKFLFECNIPSEIIEIYKKYHYALNENGIRLSAKEYQEINESDILKFNNYINQEEILLKVINRFLFKGIYDYNNNVDMLIHGTIDNFKCFTKEEIVNFLLKNRFKKFDSIHFSLLSLQPWTRNLNNNPKYEYRREYVQVKWYFLDEIVNTIV